MAFETLINTITLLCLVLFGMWIAVHIMQAVGLLLVRQAYRRHSKHIFTVPFVPLQTRLFHELAVPQFLASEAIQRGDLPPATRASAAEATAAAAVDYEHSGVPPSAMVPSLLSVSSVSPTGSVITGSPISMMSSTEDSINHKKSKKRSNATEKGGEAVSPRQAEVDKPVAVPVGQPSGPVAADAAAYPAWWSTKLEGQSLVLGLQLPLQLQSTASRSLSAKLEKELRGAAVVAAKSSHSSRSSSAASKQRGGACEKGSGAGPAAATGALTAPNAQRRPPSVSLQLKQYKLTSTALLPLTAASAEDAYLPSFSLRSTVRLDVQPSGGRRHSSHHCGAGRSSSGCGAGGSPQVQAAIAAQLATAPMQIVTRVMTPASIPRPVGSSSSLIMAAAADDDEKGRGNSTGVVDFDALRYIYIRRQQRLLEVAVAEQTAMAHRGQYDRKSAKRAQRIAAVLMQYLQYTHEEDEEETVLNDSLVDEHGSPCASVKQSFSIVDSGNSSMVNRGARSVDSNSSTAASSRRKWKEPPWVPLFGDCREERGGGRHCDPPAVVSTGAAGSPSPKRLSYSFPQLPATAPPPPPTHKKRDKNKGKGGERPPSPTTSTTTAIPNPGTAAISGTSAQPVVTALPPPVHESRRSNRKRREAAADIADSAVTALEALVERVRQAQTLRPRYQALLCTINFRAERFIVRRGARGHPTWSALSTSHHADPTPAPLLLYGAAEGGGGGGSMVIGPRLTSSLTFVNNTLRPMGGQPRRHLLNTHASSSGVYDFSQSDSVNAVNNSGEFAHESSFTSAVDDRTSRGGSRGRASPPSVDETTNNPIRRNLNADLTEESAAPLDDDLGSVLGTSLISRRSDVDWQPAARSSSVLQTLPRPNSFAATGPLTLCPADSLGVAAPSTTPLGSTSANDAAMEFLCASRRLREEHDATQFSFNLSRSSSSSRPGNCPLYMRESSEESSGGSPLGNGYRRGVAMHETTNVFDATRQGSTTPSALQNTGNRCSNDGGVQRVPSPPKTAADASTTEQSPSLSPAGAVNAAEEEEPTVHPTSSALTPPGPLRGPRESDLRMAYVIGADRATLLRCLTVHATQAFSAGAQNFLCFFTRKDEQNARRRYLEEMDRQYRVELRQSTQACTRALAAAQQQQRDGQPSSVPTRAGVDDDGGDGSNGDCYLDAEALRSYQMEMAHLPPSRMASGLSPGPLRHGRTKSWHAVGVGGGGNSSCVFYSDSTDFKDESVTTAASRECGHASSSSLHSLHSFVWDNVAGVTSRTASNGGDGAVVTIQAGATQGKVSEGSLLSTASTLLPHSLETSVRTRGKKTGSMAQRRGSGYGAASENAETHGFETVPSLPSSMLSANGSFLSMSSHRDSTIVGGDLSLQDVDGGTANTAQHSNNSRREGKADEQVPSTEGERLQSAPTSDNAFAHSLHSMDSVAESGLAEQHLADDHRQDAPLHSPLTVEISATSQVLRSAAETNPSAAEATRRATAVVPAPPPLPKFTDAAAKKVGEGEGKPGGKMQHLPVIGTAEVKGKGKKTQKAATAAVATEASAATAGATAPVLVMSTTTPPQPPSFSVPVPALELPDTISDHDIRRYQATIGVTLPEQVFLLRDAQGQSETGFASFASSANANHSYGPGGAEVGGSLKFRSSPSTWRTSNLAAHTHTASTLTAQQNPSLSSVMQSGGVARVLEGQVEVAELSLDVLSRQLGPFVRQKWPFPPGRSSSGNTEGDSEDVADTDEDCEGMSNDDDRSSSSSSSSSSRSAYSSDTQASRTNTSSTSLDDEDDHRNSSGRSTRRSNRRRSPSRTAQQARKQKGRAKATHEEREARASRKTEKSSKRHRGSRAAEAASRAKRQRRRRRRRQQQQRRSAAWQRRLLRKQAAANRAGISPVSVAVLFFTAPPQLPTSLLLRLEARRNTHGTPALPLPPWALSSSVAVSGGAPVSAATHRVTDSPAVEPSQLQQLQQQEKEQRQATVCVTLIYTSTAEQVAQTLLLAGELAASARRARRLAEAASLDNSLFSYNDISNGSGHRRNSWVDELREWQQSGRHFGSPTNRYIGSSYGEDTSFLRCAYVNTNPPSPNDSVHTHGCGKQTDSFAQSATASPPPPPVSGTATFSEGEVSLVSSDTPAPTSTRTVVDTPAVAAATRTPYRSASGSAKRNGNSNPDGSSGKSTLAVVSKPTAEASSSPPLPPLLLLTESTNSASSYDGDDDGYGAPLHSCSKTAEGIARTSTSIFMDNSSSFDSRRIAKEETLCLNDDVPSASTAGVSRRSDRLPDVRDGEGQRGGENGVLFVDGQEDAGHDGERELTSAADSVVNVLRDGTSFPDGVPISVALTYVRIGNDLYAVTEVVDRTFLQYREERVIHPNARGNAVDGGASNLNSDAASLTSEASSTFSDNGEDAESRSGAGSLSNTSFSSDTPFSTLDAALEAIQNQHEATARQQRRRMHHRRRAVSTMNFGDLSYSLAGSAPARPGTRRQEVHMCWRCLSAEAAVIFLPCGHYAVCEDCAEVLADCCICKTPILSSVVLLERKKSQRAATSPKQQQQSTRRHRSSRE